MFTLELNSERKHLYVMGDFNIDLLKADIHRYSHEYLELLYSIQCYQQCISQLISSLELGYAKGCGGVTVCSCFQNNSYCIIKKG